MTTDNEAIYDQMEDAVKNLAVLQQELCKEGLDYQNDYRVLRLKREINILRALLD